MIRLRREVYLDNNATTAVLPAVSKKMFQVLTNNFGNPSSLYQEARDSAGILEESRRIMAFTIGAKPEEIIFSSCASESNNHVLKSLAELNYPKKSKIISSPIEHPSVMATLEHLGKQGIEVVFCPVDKEGRIELAKLDNLIDEKVFLVCCMLANNEIGTIQDIKAISNIARKHKVLLMSDCVQALGKMKLDVKDIDVDYATFSGHKIHGPKGAGVLYVKDGCSLTPLVHGGHQEFGLRAGTESLHNIAGFAEAAKAVPEMFNALSKKEQLKKYFITELKKLRPDIIINSPDKGCLVNTISVVFPGVINSVMMGALDYQGVSVSAGSACNTQSDEPSAVLKAIGLTDEQARSTLRFSFSNQTTFRDLQYTISVLKEFFQKRNGAVIAVSPGQLNENILDDEKTFILDVRFWHDRKIIPSISGSWEIPFFSFKKYLNNIPKDKNIYIICQAGFNSPLVAYYLVARNYSRVSFLLGGIIGWRLANPRLFAKYSGERIVKLE